MRSSLIQKSADVIDLGLRELLCKCEQTLVQGCPLVPCPIPDGLAALEGNLNDQTLILRTRRYHGAQFSAFTTATMSLAGQLRSLTIIGLPQPGSPAPVLGVDIIALHGQISLLAIDLSPTDLAFWESHCCGALDALAVKLEGATVPRKRPAFAVDTFSRLAMICGVRAGQELRSLSALGTFFDDVLKIAQHASQAALSTAARDRRASWLLAEQRNRKEHEALARIFGPSLAARYLDDFLFGGEAGVPS